MYVRTFIHVRTYVYTVHKRAYPSLGQTYLVNDSVVFCFIQLFSVIKLLALLLNIGFDIKIDQFIN